MCEGLCVGEAPEAKRGVGGEAELKGCKNQQWGRDPGGKQGGERAWGLRRHPFDTN